MLSYTIHVEIFQKYNKPPYVTDKTVATAIGFTQYLV